MGNGVYTGQRGMLGKREKWVRETPQNSNQQKRVVHNFRFLFTLLLQILETCVPWFKFAAARNFGYRLCHSTHADT